MNTRMKQVLLALGSALGSAAIAAFMNQQADEKNTIVNDDDVAKSGVVERSASSGIRGTIIDLFSDVLAETYRKIRTERTEKR